MSLHRLLRAALCAALLVLPGAAAFAWIDKPGRFIVPAPPGGSMDVMARVIGDQLATATGQPFVVENRPGAGGGIGVQALLRGSADGQVIMVTASNILTEIPHVMKTGFDSMKDVRPIYAVARVRNILVSSPALPAQDFASLVSYLKGAPGKYSYASHSSGTASHYAGLFLARGADLDLQHVPFAGSPPALQQVMSGEVTILFDNFINSSPLISAGKLRAYGVGGTTRHPNLPQVPTFVELGHPELDYTNWFGVIASSKMPDAVAERMNKAVQQAAEIPAVRDKLVALGFEMLPAQTTAELTQATRAEFERNAAIVKKFNITP